MSGAVLTIISTIIGGGIVGLPYGFQQLGLYISLTVMVLVGVLTLSSAWLYLNTKDLIQGKPESLFEIGYMLFHRSSIFFISAVLAINAFGMVMIYLITFAGIMQSIV